MKKLLSTLLLLSAVLFATCKKKETKEDPTTPVPTPVAPAYSTFTPSIAIVDYTAPAQTHASYSVNLSSTTTAMAYVVADGFRIDSLSLKITRVSDLTATPTTTWAPNVCDGEQWSYYYNTNSKAFKVKNGATNSLKIYEDGIRVVSVPIVIGSSGIRFDVADSVIQSPHTTGPRCPNFLKFVVIQ